MMGRTGVEDLMIVFRRKYGQILLMNYISGRRKQHQVKFQGYGQTNCHLLGFRSLQEGQDRRGDWRFELRCLLHNLEDMQSSQSGVQVEFKGEAQAGKVNLEGTHTWFLKS